MDQELQLDLLCAETHAAGQAAGPADKPGGILSEAGLLYNKKEDGREKSDESGTVLSSGISHVKRTVPIVCEP